MTPNPAPFAKLQPRMRPSLLRRYAADFARQGERGAAEAALRRAKEAAEQAVAEERAARARAETASRAKSEFLAQMSHELRTPLNAILGFSEMMKDGVLGPLQNAAYSGYSQDIHRSAKHLLDVINDVLDLSKIEVGRLELQEQDVDLDDAIGGSLRLVEERARRGQVALDYRAPAPAPRLRADGRRLKQILINLLANAVKFTPAGGKVSVHVISAEGGGLVIAVVDTGIGIAAADIDRVMAPFGQAETGFERKSEGTGLGLPMCRALAELHGGRLFLESKPGAGTAACLYLPAARVRWRAAA
jgi:signal transduction histidine kinase